MSESEALVSFAAAKLGASRPKCVLVTLGLFLSWKRSRGGALLAALNGGQVSSMGACAAGHVPGGSRAQRRGSPQWKGWPLGA
jgi:hypothetical protein